MVTFVDESKQVSVPSWVTTLDAFRRWVDADDFPETGRIWFLKGEVWVDVSKEQLFTHGRVRTEFTVVVGGVVDAERLGLFFASGPLLTNVAAEVSGKPDAIFVSNESLGRGDVELIDGADEGFVELAGSPDMVLEVVSTGSEHKDNVVLRQAYWESGIGEYWLVDICQSPLRFDILRHGVNGYVATRKKDGWVKSHLFGNSFRLTTRPGALGHPEYVLDMR